MARRPPKSIITRLQRNERELTVILGEKWVDLGAYPAQARIAQDLHKLSSLTRSVIRDLKGLRGDE